MSAARRKKGFERASKLVQSNVRRAGESRGFAVSRLLTHWADIVGPELAGKAQPAEIVYGKGFGATLSILTSGAEAPMLEMQKQAIQDKVNACYGYAAIQRIRIVQTAKTGFEEPKAGFKQKQTPPESPDQDSASIEAARKTASGVSDDALRGALERLGSKVLSHNKQTLR